MLKRTRKVLAWMCWRLLLWADCLTYFFKFYGTYGVAQRHNAQNVLKLKNKHHIF